jgi:DNA-binding NarL/FixJ family response regulator
MLTVIVITDEPLIEAGLRSLLGHDSDEFELVGFCRTAAEIRRACLPSNPDILLCALREAHDVLLAELREASPRSSVVVLGREFSPEYAHQALDMGIRGLVSSSAGMETLRDCLRRTGRGELWMENALSIMLLDTRPVRLSRRQSELIQLLAQGLKNKEIAGILGIAEGTVKAYLTALFDKVGAKDRFELALLGLKHLKHVDGERGAEGRLMRPVRSFVARRPDRITAA